MEQRSYPWQMRHMSLSELQHSRRNVSWWHGKPKFCDGIPSTLGKTCGKFFEVAMPSCEVLHANQTCPVGFFCPLG